MKKIHCVLWLIASQVIWSDRGVAQTVLDICGSPAETISEATKAHLRQTVPSIVNAPSTNIEEAAKTIRTEIYVNSSRSDVARELHYFNYLSCVVIFSDRNMTADERLVRIKTLRSVFVLNAPELRPPETRPLNPEKHGTLFDPMARDGFIARYSLGYAPYTWHVIVGSFFDQKRAQEEVDRLNHLYEGLFFQETQSNTKETSGKDIWMVTLGSGVGRQDVLKLLRVARYISQVYGDFNGPYQFCWSVGRTDPGGECKQ